MATGLIDVIKRAAIDAIDNGQMCDLRYGQVISVSPLRVKVTNQFILPARLLIVPQHLTNYSVSITVNWDTQNTSGGSDESAFSSHSHAIDGTKTMTINNALKVGDKVALMRKQGGQAYFILDRI